MPGQAVKMLPCENEIAKVIGYIDYESVFNRNEYPQLPYEKFVISDSKTTFRLEVWVTGDNNSGIFNKITENRKEEPVYLTVKI